MIFFVIIKCPLHHINTSTSMMSVTFTPHMHSSIFRTKKTTATAKFKVDQKGEVTCKNLNVTGGKIGNFLISDTYLQTAGQEVGFGSDTDWAFWAGCAP